MRVQPDQAGPLQALNAVLRSIESVRNGPALYLLLLSFAGAGMLLSQAQRAMGGDSGLGPALWAGGAFFVVFYGTSAAGLVVMDEAQGRRPRHPRDALRDALGLAHRLLAVVLVVVLGAALLLAVVAGLLWACRLPLVGPLLLGAVVAVTVPAMGLAALVMLALVGPIAAPAVWCGCSAGRALRLIARQVRHRLAHAVLLSAAVSLLSAAVAGLVSFVVLAGGRALLLLSVPVAGLDLAPQPLLAALFGQVLRVAPGGPPMSAHTAAAVTGAGVVFALGLVLPGVVYLRGLCELYLALRRLDEPPPPETPAA